MMSHIADNRRGDIIMALWRAQVSATPPLRASGQHPARAGSTAARGPLHRAASRSPTRGRSGPALLHSLWVPRHGPALQQLVAANGRKIPLFPYYLFPTSLTPFDYIIFV